MKKIKSSFIFVLLFFFSTSSYSQLWKQYNDSAHLFEKKEYEKALHFYLLAKENLPVDSFGTLSHSKIISNLAALYYYMGQYAKAEPLYIEAKNIIEKVLGKAHPDYVSFLNNLANLYSDMGQYQKALPLYIEAKKIREKVFGKNHLDYAASCNNLAVLYDDMGQYEKAEPLYIKAKILREKTLGKNHLEYASSCNNLALLYRDMGQFEKAEFFCIEAKIIIEKVLGKNHLKYASSCHNLALIYLDMGQYEKAEPFCIEAKNIREKILGKNNPDYASSCNLLGALYDETGQYEKAEPFSIEAKNIREKILGINHPYYAHSCDNLAGLYRDMGQYAKAEPLYIEAKNIREKALGKDHPDYASSCHNLALLYTDMGQFEKAVAFCIEAKKIREKVLGKNHPDYASSCNILAILYNYMGQYEKAESLYIETKNIREKAIGKNNPDYASSCNNLAVLYEEMGQYEKAEPLYVEAKNIREKVLGINHPYHAQSCYNLFNLYWNMKQPLKAESFLIECFNINAVNVNKTFQFTSEMEKGLFIQNVAGSGDNYYSFYYDEISRQKNEQPYDISLFNRNLILASLQSFKKNIYFSKDTLVHNKFTAWVEIKKRLAILYTNGAGKDKTKELEEKGNILEKKLIVNSSTFQKQQHLRIINCKDIQHALKFNEVSIEFVEFNYNTGKRLTDSTYYIALVLRKDKTEPMLVPLFEKKQLDSLLLLTANKNTIDNVKALYASSGVGIKNTSAISLSLYNLIWKPLENELKGINTVYFAPAGVLHRVAFAALPVNDKQVLSDQYKLIQLATTASVTDQVPSFINTTDNIQLYGGIKYDADSAVLKQVVNLYAFNKDNIASRSIPDDLDRGSKFNYLPGTEDEINSIEKQTEVTNNHVNILSGINATEESFKALDGKSSPVIIHIATHGFFFPDPKEEKDKTLAKFETSGKVFKQSDNPLFRSGLLFAGANYAWKGKPVEGIEDGILSSYEVSNMYLPNTKLVVLSACETALGDIQGSEGVYGLQRAFKIAGVQNLVMSLWKVPDAETSEFMQLFYKNLFDKESISDAFYNAQTIMKNKYRTEPYKWAAWILIR